MRQYIYIPDDQLKQNKCIYITKQNNLTTYDVLHDSVSNARILMMISKTIFPLLETCLSLM